MPDPNDPNAPAPTPAAPGNANAVALSGPFTAVRVTAVQFVGNHGVITQWTTDEDLWKWTAGSGIPCQDPSYQEGKDPPVQPATRTAGGKLQVQLTVQVSPPDAAQVACTCTFKLDGLTGNVASSYDGQTTWPMQGGTNTLTMTSTEDLPSIVSVVAGDLSFRCDPGNGPVDAPAIANLCLILTAGVPIDPGGMENGRTSRQALRACKWVSEAGTSDVRAIISKIMAEWPEYASKPDPDFPKAILNHPGFNNMCGGAWWLTEPTLVRYTGECQAIVRATRAMLLMTGITGFEFVLVWADPDEGPNGPAHVDTTGNGINDRTRTVNGETQQAALTDVHVEVGQSYTEDEVGWNNFEACGRWSDAQGTTYYAGGAGQAPSAERVLKAFHQLVWVVFSKEVDANGVVHRTGVVREIVRAWKGADGQALDGSQ